MLNMDYMYDDYDGDVVDRTVDFLADILSYMGYDAEIHTEVMDNTAIFDVLGDDVGCLSPEKDPSVINAISWILKRARFALGSGYRFDLDINSFRLERIRRLEGVANEVQNKIRGGVDKIQIFGMDNVDRRAVHMLLNASQNVSTQSDGYGNYRHIEIRRADP